MKNQRGLTLVELLLSMTMLGAVMLATYGLSTNSVRLSKARSQEMGAQSDMTYAVRRIEFILQKYMAENEILTYSANFLAYPADSKAVSNLFITRIDPQTGSGTPLDTLSLVHFQDSEFNNTLGFTNAPQGQFSVAGFEPYARLTDLNNNGQIDQYDINRRNNCLKDYNLCKDQAVGGLPPLFFSLSPNGDILYISYRAARRNKSTGLKQVLGPGITKAIYLRSFQGDA